MRPRDRSGTEDGAAVVLGIDVGTTNTKSVLVRVDAGADDAVEELATAAVPTPDDAWGLLDAIRRTVGRVLDRRPDARPAAVGIASMAETGVPLGVDGAPLTPLLRWDGHRASTQADGLAAVHGREALFAATGVRPSAKVPLATWLWLADQGVRMHRWAGVADLAALALTGRLVTDHTLAGRTMAYRAVVDGPLPTSFDHDLLAAVGLTPDALPTVAAPDAVAGHVGDVDDGVSPAGGIAGALGHGLLPRGIPVVVAGHDHAVGTWAAGVRSPGRRADSIGTAEAVLTVVDRPPEPARVASAGMSWVRTAAGDRHAVLGGSSSAGAMLGWLDDRLTIPLDEALARAAGDTGATGLVVLPYLTGRQTPAPDPHARATVVRPGGEVLTETEVRALGAAEPGRLARAVLEGVCLQARWMLREQGVLAGPDVGGPVVVLGAGVRAVPAWAAAKRLVGPGPLAWLTADEPVAVGAAVLAAARAGLLGDPDDAVLTAPALATESEDVVGDARDVPAGTDPDRLLAEFVRIATAPTRTPTPTGDP